MDKWDIRRIYLYLVALITLIMIITGTVGVLQATINIALPQPTSPDTYKWRSEDLKRTGDYTDEQIQQLIKEQQAFDQQYSTYWEWKRLIEKLVLVLVAIPVYWYHWRLINKSEAKLS